MPVFILKEKQTTNGGADAYVDIVGSDGIKKSYLIRKKAELRL